ncbi:hypothetical protein L6260_00600 [Candidatus Parcubacteria bacterium]|nr:hypothetical protein [Patescibacteria group bacterium]MCG2687293.1 hypothetical protein [Candidatus Parcubacteria bacterium]
MQTFAILGSHSRLSLAELKAVTKTDINKSSDQSAVFEYNKDLLHLQNKLGGTQKLGEVLGSVKDAQEIEAHLLAILKDQVGDNKLRFGISVYDLGDTKRTKELQKFMLKVGINLKKAIKQSGRSARLVTAKEPTLSTVVVAKNKLISDGVEFVIMVGGSEILIGVTKAIQDFEDWSHRDYDRPARDARSGMLPPKLARMMVNLAGVDPKNSYLLDPFCGSGTILMEASLLGFDNVIGSDISKNAIDDTRENLQWLIDQNYPVADHTLICSSADFMSDKLDNNLVDVIVTEPFLGNPRSGREQEIEITRGIKSLSDLYESSFLELDKILRPGGKMVIASPIHFIDDKEFPVPTIEIMESLGYSLEHEPMLYKRETQFVGRNILIFAKK